jgi:hypothetical protein
VIRPLCIALGFILTCQIASAAEARWCSITGKRKTDTLVYPPMAKASRVDGIVILRVHFSTDGGVLSVESISGPQTLVDPTRERLKSWQFHTDAVGDQPCQSLIVVKYRILPENYDLPTESTSEPQPHPSAGIYQISVDSYTITII